MTYFDHHSAVFLRNIYARPKGQIRLAVLQRDLAELLPPGPLAVLDVGGGAGQMALWLGARGHWVEVLDIAPALLAAGRAEAEALRLDDRVHFVEGDIFARPLAPDFDLICCHALLEWLPAARQEELIQRCAALLRPGGALSLLVYNREALVFAQHVFGNFAYLDRDFRPHRKTAKLTPPQPCTPAAVESGLAGAGFQIQRRSNVRCFYDYMKPADRERHPVAELVARELALADEAAYGPVARYLHYFAVRP